MSECPRCGCQSCDGCYCHEDNSHVLAAWWASLRQSVHTMQANSDAHQAFTFGLVLDEMTTIELAEPVISDV